MTNDAIEFFIEWIWAPLAAAVLFLFRQVFTMNARVRRLETLEEQREKYYKDRKDDHRAQMNALKEHNDAVLATVERLSEQVRGNGHRLGTIENHLMNRGKD